MNLLSVQCQRIFFRFVRALVKKTSNIFSSIFPFLIARGKELVEEIKSETSGDLQTTLIKLAEVGCHVVHVEVFYFNSRSPNCSIIM